MDGSISPFLIHLCKFLLRPSVQEVWSGQVFEVEITASLSEETVQSLVGSTLYLDLPWLDDDGHALFLDADAICFSFFFCMLMLLFLAFLVLQFSFLAFLTVAI